jgi:hypothetical protein
MQKFSVLIKCARECTKTVHAYSVLERYIVKFKTQSGKIHRKKFLGTVTVSYMTYLQWVGKRFEKTD